MTDATQQDMTHKFKQLHALGAGEFAHLNGSLETHLVGTYSLLKNWHASQSLCDAGLYHAAYGTAGFEQNMLGIDRRSDIASIIGEQAEAIVYLYCACDREYVFERIQLDKPIQFRDRFNDQCFVLTHQQSCDFCALTVANELEIAQHSVEFIEQHGVGLQKLFAQMQKHLSEAAKQTIKNVLGDS